MEKRLIRMLHVNRVREPHVNLDSFPFHTVSHRKSSKFHLKIPTRDSQHEQAVYSLICHKQLHIMWWKDQTSKEIATCGKFVSLSSCCEQAAAGLVRAFPVHFVPLQSNSTQCTMHGSCADTKNCMKYGFSYETDFWGKLLWIETFLRKSMWNLSRFMHKILHINCACEPHVTPRFLHISHIFSHKKMIKIPLENPYTWVTTLSTVKSVTNTFISWHEKTKKENKNRPVGSLFLLNSCCEQAAAGMIRVFPVHFVPLQSNSTQCNIHDSRAATENCMKCGISYETHFWPHFIQFITPIQPEISQWSRD